MAVEEPTKGGKFFPFSSLFDEDLLRLSLGARPQNEWENAILWTNKRIMRPKREHQYTFLAANKRLPELMLALCTRQILRDSASR